jgi:hypothetical protein
MKEGVMEQQDKFGIRAELEKPDDPRPKLSRATTVRELTAALSQCDPEEEIWIVYRPSRMSGPVSGVRRLEISDIFDEYETRRLGIDPHERREGKTGDSDVDQEKLRIVLIREAENVFGSKEKAHVWLNMPSPQLNDQTPMNMLATADGQNRVHEMLVQIDEGM